MKWNNVSDGLPDLHRYVIVQADRYWNTPDGIQDMKVSAVGYLNDFGGLYWSIFGERGFEISAFSRWAYIEETEDSYSRIADRLNK